MTPQLEAALRYVRAGISVVPVKRDGSKTPAVRWDLYQERLPTEDELARWFGHDYPLGLALVGGEVSGALEQLDFDKDADALLATWSGLVEAECPGLVGRLWVTRTPRPGYHVRWRCPDLPKVPGNRKLAVDESGRCLVETRGEGGYAMAPPSPSECHPSGELYRHHSGPDLPTAVSLEEREVLLRCARSLTRAADEGPRQAGLDLRPGDDYDRRGPDWSAILEPHGWRCVSGGQGGERRWRRPGKDGPGWSATTGHCRGADGADLLRVFSSNAAPFEDGKAYGKFRARALLEFRGDLSACADALAREGYGTRRQTPAPSANGHANGHAANGRAPAPRRPATFPPPIPASRLRHAEGQPWLWHGYLAPGSVTLLSALWKAGKTTLLAHLLRALEAGGEFCGQALAPGRCLYVTEESEGRWARRRDQLRLADHISFLVRPFRGKPDWDDWSDFVRHLADLVARDPVQLVVLDPLVNLWPVRDENDNAQVLSALLPLQQVATTPALLLSHHHRKGDGQEATAARGAGAFMAFVDTIVELRRYAPGARDDKRRVLTAYGRDDETPDELVVELTDAGYVSHGERSEVSVLDLLPVIAGMLPGAPPGWTRNEVYEQWPEGRSRPQTSQLLEALHRGAAAGSWIEQGDGRRGRPFRFYRPPSDSNTCPTLYRDGHENETEAPDFPTPFSQEPES